MKTSIVIPTYNESENIEELLKRIQEVLSDRNFEILVVDDNSPDDTAGIVEEMSEEFENIRLMVREGKKGLGSAYKEGFTEVDGDILIHMDADFSHPVEHLVDMIDNIGDADVVVGSRDVEGGKRKDGIHRQIPALIGSFLYRKVLGSPVNDITSGFKAYKSELKPFLTSEDLPSGYSYQPSSLMKIVWSGYEVKEIPIDFRPRKAGEPKFSFLDILDNVKVLIKLVWERYFGGGGNKTGSS